MLRAVMEAVASWGGRGWLAGALTVLVYQRLSRLCGQMERLAARFQAGRLRQAGPRVAAPGAASDAAVRRRGVRVWPGRFAWLVRLIGYRAAGYGAQLQTVLGEPEMVALLAASPQARRLLRPVCRMLAVDTRMLRPATVTAQGDAARLAQPADAAAPPRVRRKPAPVDWGRIPLPRGVLSAARRQGFPSG